MHQYKSYVSQVNNPHTSTEHTAFMAAATVVVEYPNGDKNPAFRSFSYLIAS